MVFSNGSRQNSHESPEFPGNAPGKEVSKALRDTDVQHTERREVGRDPREAAYMPREMPRLQTLNEGFKLVWRWMREILRPLHHQERLPFKSSIESLSTICCSLKFGLTLRLQHNHLELRELLLVQRIELVQCMLHLAP